MDIGVMLSSFLGNEVVEAGGDLEETLIESTLHDMDTECAKHLNSDLSEITLQDGSLFLATLRFGRKDWLRGFTVDEVSSLALRVSSLLPH
jgi:hypothetical protein